MKYVCRFCNKELEFEKGVQYGSHARNCDQNPDKNNIILRTKNTRRRIFEERDNLNRQKYSKNPDRCKFCDKPLLYETRKYKYEFCSGSCAGSFNNTKRKGIKYKLSSTGIANLRLTSSKRVAAYKVNYYKNPKKCIACGNDISYEKRECKTCSMECHNQMCSVYRIKAILKRGTDNFKTKTTLLHYKFLEGFRCDSVLEKAALIYLIDIFKATSIEKFKSILSFKENGITRRFNPDFYVKKGDEVYIVEVKMKWTTNSNHDYNRTIPLKKEALNNFCTTRGFKMIWLDTGYDPRFNDIYKKYVPRKKVRIKAYNTNLPEEK